ncbi:excisionase family DNA-binding protein [Aeromicrobium piscarium]|uniref:Helix-turn-helix domain-containing protein n=1 Tax=Aeromicrobium piscarium TaxID=2590901 RepID=A0A554SBD0_9ACTN|nr:excisionase family DNA-binding protein [Aeromicrobium piscarium]TSD63651.1 helix-turn-helix domain-containing protein [Aeromicrobium piscarium]
MATISVAEAAKRLGVSRQRVVAMIQSGSLPAVKVGRSYVIDAAAVSRHRGAVSRPLSPRMAAALLRLAAHEKPGVSASEVSRLRGRLARLHDAADPVGLVRGWLPGRARRLEMSAAAADLQTIAADPRLMLAGVSDPRAGMQSSRLVEGYVHEADAEGLFGEHFVVQAPSRSEANVIVHVADPVPPLSPLLVAADLADYREGREERQAATVLNRWISDSDIIRPRPRATGGR